MKKLKKLANYFAISITVMATSIIFLSCSEDEKPAEEIPYEIEGEWEGVFTMFSFQCINQCADQTCYDNCIAQEPVDNEITMTITGDEVVLSGYSETFEPKGSYEISGNSIIILLGDEEGGTSLEEFRYELVGTINKTTNTITGTITQYENNVPVEFDYDFTFEVTKL